MFFKKRPPLDTPMDHFRHRADLSTDERAVLDVYLTGVIHAMSGMNAVQTSNGLGNLFDVGAAHGLDVRGIEELIGAFLTQRPDMVNQPLGLCAVIAVMQRYPA